MARGMRKDTPACYTGFIPKRRPRPEMTAKKPRAKKQPNRPPELNDLRPRELLPKPFKVWMAVPKN
eukprot:1172076-Heterocapsa_arctica.AAC.1